VKSFKNQTSFRPEERTKGMFEPKRRLGFSTAISGAYKLFLKRGERAEDGNFIFDLKKRYYLFSQE